MDSVLASDGRWPVIVGDCVEVMAGMAADSVDAIVTDPPYGLEFMGKEWDRLGAKFRKPTRRDEERGDMAMRFKGGVPERYIAGQAAEDWHRRWAVAAYRVLKPGGHMLVAGIGRTHHRMMCGVEDAGFEVRDTIWNIGVVLQIFGSGFPKGSRVNRDPRFCQCAVAEHNGSNIGREQSPDDRIGTDFVAGDGGPHKTDVRRSRRKAEDSQVGYQPSLGLHGEPVPQDSAGDLECAPSPGYVPGHSRSAALSDDLNCESLHSLSQVRYSDRLSNLDYSCLDPAAVPTRDDIRGNTQQMNKIDSDSGSLDCHRPSNAEFLSDTLPFGLPPTQEFSTGFPRCQICGKPNADGWNVALKPAVEVWALFRKPLSESNVAANMLHWGTGAINVDGCRVATDWNESDRPESWKASGFGKMPTTSMFGSGGTGIDTSKGRWPPNLVLTHDARCERVGEKRVKGQVGRPNSIGKQYHSNLYGDGICRMKPIADADGLESVADWRCHPDCPVAELGRQSGENKSTGGMPLKINSMFFGEHGIEGHVHAGGLGDTGTAARFFPQSAYEDADFWPFRYVAKASRAERNNGLQNPGARRKRNDTAGGKYAEAPNPPGSNLHPTVKPVALMRWLLTLVTPPSGLVLDPFAGSGSTLVAAKMLGIRCVGIEQDAHYADIAAQRIAATQAALVLDA